MLAVTKALLKQGEFNWGLMLLLLAAGGYLLYKGIKEVKTKEATGCFGRKVQGDCTLALGIIRIFIASSLLLMVIVKTISALLLLHQKPY